MNRFIKILLVEDDGLDQIEVKRTLDKKGIVYKMQTATNGEEAISLLKGKNEQVFSGKPDIVLLDLNLPKMDGHEFLKILKKNDEWKDIKVFVLTTSDEIKEKEAVQNLGVSGYIVKPLRLNGPGSLDSFNLMIDLMNMQN